MTWVNVRHVDGPYRIYDPSPAEEEPHKPLGFTANFDPPPAPEREPDLWDGDQA